eukprot:scaffold83364_cov19-Tisochrysis_lutea.AAC.2
MGSSSNRMRSAMGRHPLLSVRAYQPRTDLMPKVPSGRMYSLGECIKSLDADRVQLHELGADRLGADEWTRKEPGT